MAAETPVTPYLMLKAEPNWLLMLMMRLELIAQISMPVVVLASRMDASTTTVLGEAVKMTRTMSTW